MAGGNYSNQLYKDYEDLSIAYDEVVVELKKQTKQHKIELNLLKIVTEENKQLEKTIEAMTDASQEQTQQLDAAKKEIARLNQILGVDSHNSGTPTSQTPIQKKKRVPNSRTKTGKKRGGQKGHKRFKLKKFKDDEVNACEEHQVLECPHCQGTVEKIAEGKTKDQFDYEVVLVKKRHSYPVYQCTQCHKKSHSAIPNHLKEENQYGPRVQAMALTFMNEGNVSINKAQSMIEGFTFGEIIPSEGFLAKLQGRAAKVLMPFSEEIRRHLLQQSLIHWDDTVIMVNQKRACLRFYGDEKFALFKAHQQKNKDGVMEDQLLTLLNEETKVVHDHLTMNYSNEFSYTNIECNAHLLRDLQRCVENTQHKWSDRLATLITEMHRKRKERIIQGIDEFSFIEIDEFFVKFDEYWLMGDKENKQDPHLYYMQKERALLNRLQKYRIEYFSWVLNFDIPFSNNVSERSLRGVKSKMKIAGQFQHITSAQNYAAIRTYTETCKRHGLNIVDAFQRAAEGRPYTLAQVLTNQIDE